MLRLGALLSAPFAFGGFALGQGGERTGGGPSFVGTLREGLPEVPDGLQSPDCQHQVGPFRVDAGISCRAHDAGSRSGRGSKSRGKKKAALARAQEARRQELHRLADRIVNSFDFIAVESPRIRNILRKSRSRKGLHLSPSSVGGGVATVAVCDIFEA